MRELKPLITATMMMVFVLVGMSMIINTSRGIIKSIGGTDGETPTSPPSLPPAPSPVTTPSTSTSVPQPSAPDPIKWGTVGTVLIIIAAVIVGIIVLAITVYFISNKIRARRKAAKAETETRVVIEKKWAQGVAVHDEVYDSWTRFLFPETLEDLENRYFVVPLLDDMNEKLTKEFVDSLNKLDAAHMPSPLLTTTLDDAARYVELAQTTKSAYGAAWRNAKRLSEQGITFNGKRLSPENKSNMRKAQGILRQAMDPSTEASTSQNYLIKMNDLLRSAGVIIPEELAARTLELASGKLALESGK